jgi:hypothetical protein
MNKQNKEEKGQGERERERWQFRVLEVLWVAGGPAHLPLMASIRIRKEIRSD